MGILTTDQINKLRVAGVSPVDIRAYDVGMKDPNLEKKIQTALSSNIQVNKPGGGLRPPVATVQQPAVSTPVVGRMPTSISGSKPPARQASNIQAGYPPGWKPSPGPAKNPVPSGGGKSQPLGGLFGGLLDTVSRSVGGWGQNAGANSPYPEAPGIPDIPGITPPTIEPKDFSEEARKMAAEAFAPLIASLDQSKVNVGQQGERTRKILSGLYENMVSDIAESAAQTSAQYTAQQGEASSRDQALQQTIGGGYDKGQQQVTDVAQQLGLGSAVPQAVGQMEGDQQWLQGMAGVQGNAFQNYLGAQKQGAADQAAGWQDVARTSGQVAQESNLNQVAQMLAGIDQDIAGATTNQLSTAIDIGQQLTDRDLQAQTTNAGFNMTAQQAAQEALLRKYQMQNDQYGNQVTQWNADRDYNRQVGNDSWERQMQQAQLDLEAGKAAAESKAGGSVDASTALGKAQQDIQMSFPNGGLEAYNIAQQAWSALDQDGVPNNEKNMQNWISAVTAAGQGKIPPEALQYAAMQMWSAMKGRE